MSHHLISLRVPELLYSPRPKGLKVVQDFLHQQNAVGHILLGSWLPGYARHSTKTPADQVSRVNRSHAVWG